MNHCCAVCLANLTQFGKQVVFILWLCGVATGWAQQPAIVNQPQSQMVSVGPNFLLTAGVPELNL
jgi:hypothetical protein